MVCKLKKNSYGLKEAPRQWYKKFDGSMCDSGFNRYKMDHYCFFKKFDDCYIILLLYVNNMLVARSSMKEINKLKQ